MQPLTAFSEEDIQNTKPEMKIGLLATVTPEGFPHITLLSSLMACAPSKMCFGQFVEGTSKKHILENPKVGFLIMSLDKNLWRGKANYTHRVKEGAEYDYYNNTPMFRYNAYFGVHTVYYFDLVNQSGKSPLPMNKIVAAAVQTRLARAFGRKTAKEEVANRWTRDFLNKMDNLKFLSYVGADGYPLIIPAIQTQSLDSARVLFSTSAYSDEIEAIPAGVPLAVFGMALTMEDVLLRGTYQGVRRIGGIKAGVVELNWVYNPMPPAPGQVYPPLKLNPVRQF
ncbi:MAG: pyridoxamine 5'-phosphate oxidase family protein [Chloroflexi bacterium]|nr:pyridoxamine 5'-phosphate oxidase family protein [Chloroflexota bacterium]MCA2002157.1 pyridoxamine 5'-phosphate oxidase family protein [Chloroflexota bacterium]